MCLCCLYCLVNGGKNPFIEKNSTDYHMFATEHPYANIFFHKKCLFKIEDMEHFLIKNLEFWFN